ncbi:MAG: hypothetical protein QXT79_08445 [Thermofilaceae archaeon]
MKYVSPLDGLSARLGFLAMMMPEKGLLAVMKSTSLKKSQVNAAEEARSQKYTFISSFSPLARLRTSRVT